MILTPEGTLTALALAAGLLVLVLLAMAVRTAVSRGRRSPVPSRLTPRGSVRLHVPAGPLHQV